jgi:putative SOS response-associated peptidase YedK
MCGRFSRHRRDEIVERFLPFEGEYPDLAASYNVAPTQQVIAFRSNEEGRRVVTTLRWGLIPSWAKDASISAHTSNARAETLLEKPSFKTAFRNRRCIIPADGFYEWSREGKEKIPWYFGLASGEPLGLAGLWDKWRNPEGNIVESCTIITTTPNELLGKFHNRMAAILRPDEFDVWLDPKSTRGEDVAHLLRPFPADDMIAYRVSKFVNNVRNNSDECIAPS